MATTVPCFLALLYLPPPDTHSCICPPPRELLPLCETKNFKQRRKNEREKTKKRLLLSQLLSRPLFFSHTPTFFLSLSRACSSRASRNSTPAPGAVQVRLDLRSPAVGRQRREAREARAGEGPGQDTFLRGKAREEQCSQPLVFLRLSPLLSLQGEEATQLLFPLPRVRDTALSCERIRKRKERGREGHEKEAVESPQRKQQNSRISLFRGVECRGANALGQQHGKEKSACLLLFLALFSTAVPTAPRAQRRSKWFSSEEKARGLFPNRAHEPNISFPKPKKPRRRRKRN